MAQHGTIRIGIGGWTYAPWRGAFYPDDLTQKRELEYASTKLSSIEVNGTYYGSQKPASFRKWHDETPDDFVFALKGPRYATNRRVLAEAGESIDRFIDSGIGLLGKKLGPINWQFMATKKFDAEDFEAFLSLLPGEADGQTLRHAVEVRHESFCTPEFIDLARKYGAAIITAGDSDYPSIGDQTGDFAYLRLMGTEERYKAGYGPKALDAWAGTAKSLSEGHMPDSLKTVSGQQAPGARDVFVYVIGGHKVANPLAAMELIKRVG
ncbi:DUF72 domain-containing protein [Henriciella aquimarina]|uniref:DUF72 domain-containing protein n=1 Tax=Henriciella aquimarina TaxID=545261 RepID=UPI000A074B5B|nr:DUF72 domain-containing protein [Henriciella aquimarina]